MNKLKLTTILAVASLGLCLPASAGLAVDHTGVVGNQGTGTWGGSPDPYQLGLDFTVLTPFVVNTVGVFDDKGDGFGNENISVAIFRLNGTQVAGTGYTFNGTDGVLVQGSRTHTLASLVTLTPGDYSIVVAGLGSAANYNWNAIGPNPSGNVATFDNQGGALEYRGGYRYDVNGLAPIALPGIAGTYTQPVFGAGTFGFIEPEFVTQKITAVPEPSTYLAGLSALGMLVFGWRNRK